MDPAWGRPEKASGRSIEEMDDSMKFHEQYTFAKGINYHTD